MHLSNISVQYSQFAHVVWCMCWFAALMYLWFAALQRWETDVIGLMLCIQRGAERKSERRGLQLPQNAQWREQWDRNVNTSCERRLEYVNMLPSRDTVGQSLPWGGVCVLQQCNSVCINERHHWWHFPVARILHRHANSRTRARLTLAASYKVNSQACCHQTG